MTNAQLTMYITLVTTSGVLSAFLFLYAFLRRAELPASRIFLWYTAAQIVYAFGFAFELTSETLGEVRFWTAVEYAGMPFIPVLGLLLTLRYIGRPVRPGISAALFAIPAVSFLLVATNQLHHLFYKSISLPDSGPPSLVVIEPGQWYIVHGAYTFACLLACFLLLLRQWRRTNKAYRFHLTALIAGQLLPMVAAFLYLMGVTPGRIDPVPVVMCLTSALYIWALLSTRTSTIVPIAKESLFESMREGVLVLDSADRIVDFNEAAIGMLPSLKASLIGLKLDEAWHKLTGETFTPGAARSGGLQNAWIWEAPGGDRYYEIRSSAVRLRTSNERVGSLLMFIDITELRRLQVQLERQAHYDGLTGILNRTQFLLRFGRMLSEGEHRGRPVSVILFDIDYFKQVNDGYGHDSGDRLLIHVVSVCRKRIPDRACFARYGGEEFAIALPDTYLLDAGALAEQLRVAIAASPLIIHTGTVTISASFGVSQSGPDTGLTPDKLLKNADNALYVSKRAGRNQVNLSRSDGSK